MIDEKTLLDSSILIVDDNPTNIVLLENILERKGYENYTSTADPRTVVPLNAEEHFDLILLDIRMPHMSGIEVLEALKEQIKDEFLPVLVLTAQTDEKTRQEALEAGATDFLTKPFQFWEVLLRIKNMLESRYYYKQQVERGDILEAEVRRRTKAIRETQLEVVQRLGRAGEFRDNQTGAHVMRVSKVAEIIARGMGFDDEACEIILYASPMHDVGKIAIPDSILLKPGPLTPEEWEIMKSHSAVGGEIMGDHPSEVIWAASQIARYHHERWDGQGYPEGLKGDVIPIFARITAISDVFDALTSARPYKTACPMDEAVEYIKKESGKHFDPRVVNVFLNCLSEIFAVREEFPDD
ncbi:HD domain-containing phosphohydrolase [Desulfovibrio sp. JC022]|uniref:HD domain-containing phosphohydrolase n=1 Tax=Desulfovibrio sp. JC022 TaxID=2593642 RepID=UPI0013D8B051|nr:HD domain-containing phosphohydrolase [Desulfovibrio sp. JC022]NDV22038.1 response regulator [Desulfovibrio sp. JC022]